MLEIEPVSKNKKSKLSISSLKNKKYEQNFNFVYDLDRDV